MWRKIIIGHPCDDILSGNISAIALYYYMHFDNAHNSMTDNTERTKQRETSVNRCHFHSRMSAELIPRRIRHDRMVSARAKERDRFSVYVLSSPLLLSSQGGLGRSGAISRERDRILRGPPRFISRSSLVRPTSTLSDIKWAKWFWRGVRERQQRRRGYGTATGDGAAFHNPLCPVPIKRCCHAYGQELTGRSQHGHGSARIRARTSISTGFSLRKRSSRGLTQEETEEEEGEVDYGSIGEHLDLWMYRQLSDRVTYNRTPHAHVRVNTWTCSESEKQSGSER